MLGGSERESQYAYLLLGHLAAGRGPRLEAAVEHGELTAEAEAAQHPPHARRPHDLRTAVQHDVALIAHACGSKLRCELRRGRQHVVQQRTLGCALIQSRESSADVDERSARYVRRCKAFRVGRHGVVDRVEALSYVQDAELVRARCELALQPSGADERTARDVRGEPEEHCACS